MTGRDEKRRWKRPKAALGEAATGPKDGVKRAYNAKDQSSRKWIERQLNDPYVAKAKADGLRARAAYKLMELDDKFGLIRRGARIADLGAAPGGWAQVALDRGAGAVVGVDLLDIEPLPGAVFLLGDVTLAKTERAVLSALGGAPDLVLSDMAANTVGHAATDHLRTTALAEIAADFAVRTLKPGGAFVTKVFQGGAEKDLLLRLKAAFKDVKHAKPPASRRQSPELFLVAMGFKGAQATSP